MVAITICSDFGAQENKVRHCFHFPHLFAMKWWDWMPWSWFSECWALSQHFHSPLSLSRGSLVLLHFLPWGWCHLHICGYWHFFSGYINARQSRLQNEECCQEYSWNCDKSKYTRWELEDVKGQTHKDSWRVDDHLSWLMEQADRNQ